MMLYHAFAGLSLLAALLTALLPGGMCAGMSAAMVLIISFPTSLSHYLFTSFFFSGQLSVVSCQQRPYDRVPLAED
ncbi:MAG: hypothetical protein ACYC5N_09525 [Endomicrobiales bacterium]